MRCPKCGYISFDHLEVCGKCKKNIKEVSANLRGSVFQAEAPAFLLLQPRRKEDEKNADDVFGEQGDIVEEYIDDDLEILIEDAPEKDKEVEFSEDGRKGELGLETGKDAAGDKEEDGEIEIDFSQFEDSLNQEVPSAEKGDAEGAEKEQSFAMELPADLADISDLAPPGKAARVDKKSGDDLDIDALDFNLGLDDIGNESDSAPVSAKETTLSLDDIDFSDTLTPGTPKAPGKPGTTDMDEELNFDLDLGGLSIHKDQ